MCSSVMGISIVGLGIDVGESILWQWHRLYVRGSCVAGVVSVWAKCGTDIEEADLKSLVMFSPPQNIHKNVYLKADDPSAP
jgi:hypothetical protein